MKIYLTKEFARLARKYGVGHANLIEAVQRAEDGLIDADLGAHLIKQRVARKGGGRSGGFRTILFLKEGDRAVFLHLFEKSRQSNLSEAEKEAYREFAKILVSLRNPAFVKLVEERKWKEIAHDESEEDIPK
jgi:hypothetical protein